MGSLDHLAPNWIKEKSLDFCTTFSLEDFSGRKVNIFLYETSQGCHVAYYSYGGKKGERGGPLILNGKGESKLKKKLRKDLFHNLRYRKVEKY